MAFKTCPEREKILAAAGHVIVTGGPGCGKTTVALQKAKKRILEGLQTGQRVLFLSFSRAAVARLAESARLTLEKEVRKCLEIQTFHSFFWQLVKGHGYLLGAPRKIKLLPPHEERSLRNGKKDEDPKWNAEREKIFQEKGLVAFDLFAPKALEIFQKSVSFRKLICGRHPLIIVDEAQDTGTEQWECLKILADYTQLVCLADQEQQIYDFRSDVSPDRLKQIMSALHPLEIPLGTQNNRSPGVEIVEFGNDILARTPRGTAYKGVSQKNFRSDAINRDKAIRSAVGMLWKIVHETTGKKPDSIGYLTNWGRGVMTIARALQGNEERKEIKHRVVVDETAVVLATRVIAFCLEPIKIPLYSTAIALELIADLYKARGDSAKALKLIGYARKIRQRTSCGNAKCPPGLQQILLKLHDKQLTGKPTVDWMTVRRIFGGSGIQELELVAREVAYLMTFNRGRRISDSLAEVWHRNGTYDGARKLIEKAISEDQIMGGDEGLIGINVMTMHKSKGKEFDGVILLHLGNNISPFSPDKEPVPKMKSRRLLRVAITRAKHHVLLLTDAYQKSELLDGHHFG